MNTSDLIMAENARISIMNESGDLELGDKAAAFFKGLGLNVAHVDEDGKKRSLTRVVDLTDEPYTLRLLIDTLKIHPSEVYVQITSQPNADLVIYLGEDLLEENPFQ